MKKAILFFVSFFSIGYLYSQTAVITDVPSADQNYIRTRTYTKANDSTFLDKINYFDGLGRPIQEIQRGMNPEGKDLLFIQEYDAYGREYRQWLPVNSGGNDARFRKIDDIKKSAKANYGDARPLTETVYENSPLNRVTEQYGVGNAWFTNKRSIKTEYLTNSGTSGALSCAKFTVDSQTITAEFKQGPDKYYANGELFVTKITDEDNNVGYEFKDKLGKVILTRQINNNESLDTHYIYDNFENLRAVFPPMASDTIYKDPKQLERYSDMRANWAYMYVYDSRNRCIQKKLPGCDWIYYVYDKANRLIFSQDGVLRKKGLWAFSIPDILGRIAVTGVCEKVNGATIVPGRFDDYIINANLDIGANNLCESGYILKVGKTISSFANMSMQKGVAHTINYYDNYAFLKRTEFANTGYEKNLFFNSYGDMWADYSVYNTRYGNDDSTVEAKGLPTGSVTAFFKPDSEVGYTYSSFYYDQRGRLIQS